MRYFVAIIAVLGLTAACKNHKAVADIGTITDTTTVVEKKDSLVMEMASATPEDSIRLNVAFNSPGSGINGKALKQLKAYIERFETDNNLTLTYYQIPWGREGEVDFCFKLSTIDSKKAEEFVKGVKNLIGTADRVTMRENCNCRNWPQR